MGNLGHLNILTTVPHFVRCVSTVWFTITLPVTGYAFAIITLELVFPTQSWRGQEKGGGEKKEGGGGGERGGEEKKEEEEEGGEKIEERGERRKEKGRGGGKGRRKREGREVAGLLPLPTQHPSSSILTYCKR